MKKGVKTAAALLSAMGIMTLPRLLNLKGNELALSNSWISVLLFIICYLALEGALKGLECALKGLERAEKSLFALGGLFFGLLLSTSLVFGAELDHRGFVSYGDPGIWLAIAIWTVLFGIGAAFLWSRTEWLLSRLGGGEGDLPAWLGKIERVGKSKRIGKIKRTVLLYFLFLLCWLPVFLAVYPGFFVYDAQDELMQVITRNFTTHHPLIHVLLMGGIVQLGEKLFGSYNAGIALYTVLQMAIMAGVFTLAVSVMRTYRVRFSIRLITVLSFCFFPVTVMFTLCTAKDGLFTAAVVVFLLLLCELLRDRGAFFASFKMQAGFLVSVVAMMSLRHNGKYAMLVLVPFLLFGLRDYLWRAVRLLGLSIGAFFLFSFLLSSVFGAKKGGVQEMLTVPIQQLARVYQEDPGLYTDQERQVLLRVLPEKALNRYVPKVSDPVKYEFDGHAFSEDPGAFFSLWLKVGLRHPFTYLNAWFMTSYGFWYPDTVIDVYRGNSVFTFTYEDSSFFGYEVEEPGERESKFPWLNEWYRRLSLEIFQQKVPILSMLFSPGFLFWIYLFAGGGLLWFLRKRKKAQLLPLFFLLLLWLTVIVGPTYLPRYVAFLWFALPILVNTGYLCYTTHGLYEGRLEGEEVESR